MKIQRGFLALLLTAAALGSFFCSSLLAQATVTSIDVPAELNARLAKKGHYRKERTIEKEERRCELVDVSDKTFLHCKTEKVPSTEIYSDVLRILSTQAVVNGELDVDSSYQLLPDKFHVHVVDVVNCSPDQPQSLSKTLSVTANSTTSVQNTRSLSNTQTISTTLRWNFTGVGQAGLTLSGSQTVNLSTTTAQSWSHAVTQTEQVTVNAPPQTRSQGYLRVIEGGAEATFRGSVTFDGPVEANLDGVERASELLTAAERTFPVEGVIGVTSASQAQVLRKDTKLAESWCSIQPALLSSLYRRTVLAPTSFLLGDPAIKGQARRPTPRRPKTIDRSSRVISMSLAGDVATGTPGDLCHIAPCNEPLDGYRMYCYFDDDGDCFGDCMDEYDPVCEP